MKLRLKNFTLKHYISHMRKQSKHMQHMHALVFAGIVTAGIGAVLLYADYGFWHETYIADESSLEDGSAVTSPSEAVMRFFSEAKEQFSNLGTSTGNLLQGSESYIREE